METGRRGRLEAVHLELLLLGQADLDEELADAGALVALQLDDLSVLWVVHHRPVAGKLLEGKECHYLRRDGIVRWKTHLLADLDNLLLVVVVGEALHGSQRLAAIALLDAHVDHAVASSTCARFANIRAKRIWGRDREATPS